jgi:poly(A) polymerase
MDRLLDTLGAPGGDTRLVGGAVRDTLLALPVSDIDLATRLQPTEVMERLKAAGLKAVPTGLAHGTVTAVVGGRPVEVTTLRRDVETDGRHAVVAFTDDWRADAARRDFTINALFADPLSGEVFDYFGGEADIAARRIRFIGDPEARIAEDHLRILRFFRFHARFSDGPPDPEGLAACTARANDLMALSRERIADELLKLLGLARPHATVAVMFACRIFAPVVPEIDAAGVAALGRLIAEESRLGVAPEGLRRLAALLPADPHRAGDVALRLRLSKAARARLSCAAARNAADATSDPAALAYRHGLPCARDRLLLGEAPDIARLRALDGWEKPRLPIAGGALIARGLPAGPIVATTLREIEAAWVDANFPGGAALDAIVRQHVAAAAQ